MDVININIDDMQGRSVDVLLHDLLYKETPVLTKIEQDGKKKTRYIIKRVKNEYISPPFREGLQPEEATLPYYSTNIRDCTQLCQEFNIDWELAYACRSRSYIATINNISYIYPSASGALGRALLVHALKIKYTDKVKIFYRLLDKIVEI